MPQEVLMPQMGESITEGTVVRWLKKPGDKVRRDEPLLEISTDKVDTEVPSPAEGVLLEIRVHEGETAAVNSVVCVLAKEGEAAAVKPAPIAQPKAERPAVPAAPPPKAPERLPAAPPPARAAERAPPAVPAVPRPAEAEGGEESSQRSSPLVRKIAQEHGVDLAKVQGTGTGGRVTKKDILDRVAQMEGSRNREMPAAAAEGASGSAEPEPAPAEAAEPASRPEPTVPGGWDASGIRIEPMSIMRAKIAEHMISSKRTSAHVTTFHEVDLTEVARVRETRKESFLRETGLKLTFLPFILKGAVDALKAFPIVNAAMAGKEVHYHRDVHLGIAVALEDGLIVPIIRHAEEKSVLGLARAVADLAERARAKRLTPDEVGGGTFTVTNFGSYGSIFATPIINQPQVAILGIGAAAKRPVVLPGTDAIAVRTMAFLSLSFDHRIIDGAIADQFMSRLRQILEKGPFPLS